jgi:hypothetical protein
MAVVLKTCNKCKISKSLDLFSNRTENGKTRPRSNCKQCEVVCANASRSKKLDIYLAREKKYSDLNSDKRKAYMKAWHSANKEKSRSDNKKWHQENYGKNINHTIALKLRNRLNSAIKKQWKNGSAIRDLGCTVEELKIRLESNFQEGMNWGNYGRHGWHIDHILPLSKFDLSDPEQLKKACHYTNLQPLWAKDNISKGNR